MAAVSYERPATLWRRFRPPIRTRRVILVSRDEDEHPGLLAVYVAPKNDTGFETCKSCVGRCHHGTAAPKAPIRTKHPPVSSSSYTRNGSMGPLGEVFGALIALLVLISLVSGVVIYAPYVRNIAFGVLRRGAGPRLLQLDLHNFFGAVVLGWLFCCHVHWLFFSASGRLRRAFGPIPS